MKIKGVFLLIILFLSTGCSTIRALVGGEYNNMRNYETEDEMMNAAIQDAQDSLPVFIEALQDPQPGQSNFSIKAKFPYGNEGAAEHIWVNDVSYKDGRFNGNIGNTPIYIDDLAYGDAVSISTEEVSDWMIVQDDRLLGGFTIYVMLGEMTDENRQDYYNEFGFWFAEKPVTE